MAVIKRTEPGEWGNTDRQVVDFKGLAFARGITPTDVDGFLEFGGKLNVIFELKWRGVVMPHGQRLALARLAMAATKGGVPTFVLIGEHETKPPDAVVAASCQIREFWAKGWYEIKDELITLSDFIDRLLLEYHLVKAEEENPRGWPVPWEEKYKVLMNKELQ